MEQIFAQCKKELIQFRRYYITVMLAIFLPVLTLIIFGSALRLETKNVPLVVQDFDKTALSRDYIDRFTASNQYTLVHPSYFSKSYDESHKSIQKSIDSGVAKVVMIIPPDFSRIIKSNRTCNVQFLIDGTDVVNAKVLKNSILGITEFFLSSRKLIVENSRIIPKVRIWFNPGRREALFILPGVFTLVLALYPGILASIAMVREKEDGNILQVYASDISAVNLLLGKVFAYLIVALGQTIMTMVLGMLIFKLSFVGDFSLFFVGTVIFLFSSVIFGIMVGIFADSQASAIQLVGTGNALSIMALSGFIYPVSNIPFPVNLVSYIVPAQYYIHITRDSFVRGAGWVGCWHYVLILIFLASLQFFIAFSRLKRMQIQ